MPSIETSSTSDSSTSSSSAASGASRTGVSVWVVSGMRSLRAGVRADAADVNDTPCQQQGGEHNAPVTETRAAPSEVIRARVERAALDLFSLRGFESVTTDEVADVARISRRTFFRYYVTKADAVWG